MWWSDPTAPNVSNRRGLLAGFGALSLALAGCGFTPVYGPNGAGQLLDGAVRLITPETVDGFSLRQHLQERLGLATAPRYALRVSLSTTEERIAITRQQDTRRFNVIGTADFTLTDLASGRRLTQGTVDSFSSYAATGTTVATQAAERDAYRRLMIILADKMVDRLLVSLPDAAAP